MNSFIVALDLGGTWMKGIAVQGKAPGQTGFVQRKANPLHTTTTGEEFAQALANFCRELCLGQTPSAVVAATAGEVNSSGNGYVCAGPHLGVMGTEPWVDLLKTRLGCPVKLINDAEAFVLGAAKRGLIPTNTDVGALVVGTGVGFALVRKGRWWKPARRLLHLGAIRGETGDYNGWVSAVPTSGNIIFSEGKIDLSYLAALTGAVATTVNLFQLPVVVIGGGIVDMARNAGVDLTEALSPGVAAHLLPGISAPRIVTVEEGNRIILEGVLVLAAGEEIAETVRFRNNFAELTTEVVCKEAGIEELSPEDIVLRLAREESEAALRFLNQVPALVHGAGVVAEAFRQGGRVVYVGAGTSGRLGALDAVEIPCTFGVEPDRFIAVIAGGISDIALTIEDQFEEDISSIPDLILLGLNERDVLVGVSASGTAFFVRSALAYASSLGAATIVIHEAELEQPLAECSIRLESGPEAVVGSTRMKAGTATKKALNILSTTAMILLGKVRDSEMIDLQCCNAKLRQRAIRILMRLRSVPQEQAGSILVNHAYDLRKALDSTLGQ